jgi:hypothetical protein
MFGSPRDRLNDLLALENDRTLDAPEFRELLRELGNVAFDHPTPAGEAGAIADIFWPRIRQVGI